MPLLCLFLATFEQRSLQKKATFDVLGATFNQLVEKLLATFMRKKDKIMLTLYTS